MPHLTDDLSYSDSESAADELIAQIQDLCVLEQVSKINTSSFSDSLLPSHLETRFQKLKSITKSHHVFKSDENNPNPDQELQDMKSKHTLFLKSPSDSSKRDSKKSLKFDDSLLNSSPFSSISMDSSPPNSPPPPRKVGCLWCSPKKKKKEKSKMDWGIEKNEDEYLSALSSFSVKEQEKILRKAVKEEQKINREAEKIVKWAKQASKRMSFHGVEVEDEYEFGDDDDDDDNHKPK
ncbi:hypothetical protein M5689_002814 [Euphorbia peplus]|nr:hypothetical protein M5689_002814 [Euphorbia peplus]